jgi:ATP-dependent DNA helicase RecG
MSWTPEQVQQLLTDLRAQGGDFTEIEVKRAGGGVPSIGETLSAFGNMPEGGTLVFGLDESHGFRAVDVQNAQALSQGVAAQAREAVVPPVQITFQPVEIDGAATVFADVAGLPLRDRPCRYGGRAFLRQADGDYEMSPQEVEQLDVLKLTAAERPHWDVRSVEGSGKGDLDPDLLAAFLTSVRQSSARLAKTDDDTILRRKGVLEPRGDRLTLAGLCALGTYPQQFEPSYSITCAVELPPDSGGRTRDLRHLDGPLPDLLDQAMDWVARNTSPRIGYDPSGRARDEQEFPTRAVRELVANALVHRDLSPSTAGKRVEIRLREQKLVITNPGGLWGITVRQLGQPFGKAAVNQFLYEIAKFTRTRDAARVIEGEGGGIREVRLALRSAGLREPIFHDTGVSFIAIVPRHTLMSPDDMSWLAESTSGLRLSDVQREILVQLRHGRTLRNAEVRKEFEIADSKGVTSALQGLVDLGLADRTGRRGGARYRLAARLGPAIGQLALPDIRIGTRGMLSSSADSVSKPGRLETTRSQQTTRNASPVLATLDRPRAINEIVGRSGLTIGQVRYALERLIADGRVEMHGAQGRRSTTYAKVER